MIKMDEVNLEVVEQQASPDNIIDANEHLLIDITNPNSRSSATVSP